MFLEIEKIKKEKLEHYENNPDLFFDAICCHTLLIDQKNPLAYTDDRFVQDIFKELKSDHLPASFCLEFERAEIKWLMNCKNYTSAGLMCKASLYYLNLKFSGAWKMEINKHQQIIALTTQLSDMKSEILKLTNASKGGGNGGGTSGGTLLVKTSDESQQKKGGFPLWRLEKIPSSAEHIMVKCEGQKWYWCEDGHSFQNKVCGMYCWHKPSAGHVAWLAHKEKYKQDQAAKKGNSTPTAPATLPSPIAAIKPNTGDLSKLLLSKSLQSALMTKAGILEDQFKKIWDEACSSSGN